MEPAELVRTYPRLYHMAEEGSWPSIERHGLLSTTALLDLFDCDADQRLQLEARHRPEKAQVVHERLGTAVLRDQKPMSVGALRKVLVDCTPEEWFRILNGHVFFWPTLKRLMSFLSARAYKTSPQIVITVDTQKLLARYQDKVVLSPINSGSTIYNAVERGRYTFRSLEDYPFEERRKLRGRANAVAEVAVRGMVSDAKDIAVCVDEWVGPTKGARIWTAVA